MAALVQSKSYTGAAASSHSIVLDAGPTQGNLLVLAVVSDATVNTPSGWTVVNSAVDFTGTYMYTKDAGASESATITVSPASSATLAMAVLDYSGMSASSLDKTANATGQNTPVSTGTTATTTQADEVLVGLVGINQADSRTISSWSNSFTQQFNVATGSGLSHVRLGLALRTVAATGAYVTAATLNDVQSNCSGIIGTFKIAAAAAGQPTVKRMGGVAFAHGGYQPGSGMNRW
jgi:hypothetical protein